MHTLKKTSSMLWDRWTALLASLMITVQIVILSLGKEGLCLSQGCQVVERLTRVSPLIFNIAGLLFFQAIFWGLYRLTSEDTSRLQLVRLFLLVGLAAEGVLVGFQHIVVGSFCTYCLIVLGFIVLLNLLAGIKQLLAGAFVFGVVLLAFSSLEFKHDQKNPRAMNEGVFASKINPSSEVSVHLFYSSTCSHCQRVLEIMVKNPSISMHFNPIDMISSIDASGVILNLNYSPAANKALLNSLDIGEIPVLLERKNNGYSIIKGESAIVAYFDSLDKPSRNAASLPIAPSNDSRDIKSLIPGAGDRAEGCSVNTDCNTIPSVSAIIPAR